MFFAKPTRALILGILFIVVTATPSLSQVVTVSYENKHVNFDSLQAAFGKSKNLPAGFEKQALLALSNFPELKNIRISFVLADRKSMLLSRINFVGFFQAKQKRMYSIYIRTHADSRLEPILLRSFSFDGQVGALAHELAHTVAFSKKSSGGMLRVLLGHLSSAYLDNQEFSTDRQVIEHGLGFPLYQWKLKRSKVVLKSEGTVDANHERYMKPGTVLKTMLNLSMYAPYENKIKALLKAGTF
jgi:hypothetical protein